MVSSLKGGNSFTFAIYGYCCRSILNGLTLDLEESIQAITAASAAGDNSIRAGSSPKIFLKCPRHVALIGKTAAGRDFLDRQRRLGQKSLCSRDPPPNDVDVRRTTEPSLELA